MPVNGLTLSPSREDTQTIRPAPRVTICLAMPWVSSSGPVTLTSHWLRMFARECRRGTAFTDAGVVDENFDVPVPGLAAVAVIGDVELLDPQGHPTLVGLSFQGLHLAVDLNGGDHIETLLGQSHRDLESKASSGSGDEHLLQCRCWGCHDGVLPG